MLAFVVMSGRRSIHSDDFVLAWLLWLVIISSAAAIGCCSSAAGTSNHVNIIRCIEREKLALIQFKRGLVDDSDALASWESKEDCCEWRGIACDNHTGHVIKLDFYTHFSENETTLTGQIGPSLLELPYLNYLDLGHNSFDGTIPKFIGSLSRLKELRLGSNNFNGSIPPQLGSLSNLHTLDLSRNSLTCENLEWLSHLSSLRYLNVSYLDLSKVVNWSQPVSQLSSLIELQSSSCNLPDVDIQSLSFLNSSTSISSLEVVDLSSNKFLNSSILYWIASLSSSLVHINVSVNEMKGPIPDVFINMVSLTSLDLSFNQLEGVIPKSFRSLCKLEELVLRDNKFSDRLEDSVEILSCARDTLEVLGLAINSFWGSFPDDLTRFSSLTRLDLYRNSMSGSLPKSFQSLSQLTYLRLDWNQFSGSFPNVTGLSSLTSLILSNNKLNGSLPESVGQLTSLEVFELSGNNLSGVVTEAYLSNLSRLQYLDTSFNSLLYFNFSSDWNPLFQLRFLSMASCRVGPAFPKWIQNQSKLEFFFMSNAGITDSIPNKFWDLSSILISLDLSMNQIHGELPNLSSKNYTLNTIDLSSNRISGPLSPWPLPPTVTFALMSQNMFSGDLSSLCATTEDQGLTILDLSENQLSGELPNCWIKFQGLQLLNLAKNNFSGKIPSSFGYLRVISLLQLHDNNFSGELPSLENCTKLRVLDLGSNKLSGNIREWVSQRLTNLIVLRIRSNEFYGSIPLSLCSLPEIHVLDLSQNNISGLLPHCLNNITTFSLPSKVQQSITEWDILIEVMWKGKERLFGRNMKYLRSIDISSNYLTGDIPDTLTSMLEMRSLNLSGNNLTGVIPRHFGQLKKLEFLDLSRNQLSGRIPASFSILHSISVLNLSFNNLSGRIPRSRQLDTFQDSSFTGNVGLCGPPLTRLCPGDGTTEDPTVTSSSETKEDNDGLITSGFYVSIGIGFFTGFVGVCLTSLRNTSLKKRHGLRRR